ncbi:MAG: pyridoxamine 5'-phosphate oxidase family protein [Treponemataceae bacterium]|nr:pyridoxamine 5'-phosphate oxidase family protein [Treponemataceae bacterium]
MDVGEAIIRLRRLVEASHVGLFTTIGPRGYPRSRWMTPVVFPERPQLLYALTDPRSKKIEDLSAHKQVEWTFQSTVLNEVISLYGNATVIADSSLREQIVTEIGNYLPVFWRSFSSEHIHNVVIIETEIEGIACFYPFKNERFSYDFG